MVQSLRLVLVLVVLSFTSACSTSSKKTANAHPNDPWENWNRKVYAFNKSVDEAIAKPVTKAYKAVTPDIVEDGVSNVFANLNDIPTMVNNLLQGKVIDSFSDLGRLVINTTVGIGGIWDPASRMGLEKHDEDFGQTLGKWGVGEGPYMMLPFLGPKTLRGTVGYGVDSTQLDALDEVDHIRTRNQAKVLRLIDQRKQLMKLEDLLKDASDEYAYVRDAYLQNRRYKVLDGDIPFEDEECEEENKDDCEF